MEAEKLQINEGVLQNGFENVYNFVREQLIYEHNQQNAYLDRTIERHSTRKTYCIFLAVL